MMHREEAGQVFGKRTPRQAPRTRIFAAGVLVGNDRAQLLDCLIRDTSPQGAQIRSNAALPVPPSGYLINIKAGSAHHAHLVWRRQTLSGLRLGEAHIFDEQLPPHLEFLRPHFIRARLRQVNSRAHKT